MRTAPAQSPHAGLNSGLRAAQAGGGIAISGLPANLAHLNATYAPTGDLVAGYPSFSAGPTKHLHRHPALDEWQISPEPFDRAQTACFARIPAAAGPVPTGARAWRVFLGGVNGWYTAEVTARELDAAAAAALQLPAVVRPPPLRPLGLAIA